VLQQFIDKASETEPTVAEKPTVFTRTQTTVSRNRTHSFSQIRMYADKTHTLNQIRVPRYKSYSHRQ